MEDLARLASLLGQRNRLDAEIAALIGRPALTGHVGEHIAARLFDIELAPSANEPGIDGRFRSGALAARTVKVKTYAKREGLLDIPEVLSDYLLVLAGPPAPAGSSKGATRAFAIDAVFLFDAARLVAELRERNAKVGPASSVTDAAWERARIWPVPSKDAPLVLSHQASAALRRFASESLNNAR